MVRKSIPPKKRQFHKTAVRSDTLELIWGIHPVLKSLKANPKSVKEIIIIERAKSSPRLEEIFSLAEKAAIKITRGSPEKHGVAKDMRHQGVAALITAYPTLSLAELVSRIKGSASPPLLLALDSVQDPHNLGAIIRTALAAGVDGLIITKDRTAPLNGIAAKTSAGAIASLDICRVTNLVKSLQILKDEGVWVFGAALEGSVSLYEADLAMPLCLVIGSEGKGLRPLVREQCDFLVNIPMQPGLDSLNASVAAGVMLFEIVRQRR